MKSFGRRSNQLVLSGSVLLLSASLSLGQTPSLALSSASAVSGGNATLSLVLTSAAENNTDGLQWTFSYPAASVTGFSVIPGPVLTSGGKSISCAGDTNAYICLTSGLNTNTIPDGNVAFVTVALAQGASSISISVSDTLGASVAGYPIPVSATGGSIVVSTSSVTLSSLGCAPTSLSSGGATTCSVGLSAAATSGPVVVGLSSSLPALSVPASVTIPLNSSSAAFTATAGALSSDQTATITATLNSSSKSATLSLIAPLTLSGITASAITPSGATITWTTDKAADSQLAYGATSAYGSVSVLDQAMVTSHKINLAGLAPSTIYHYKVVSRDAQGRMAESGDFTFTTSATTGPQILLQLRSDASEVSGVTNGSIVTPAIAPPGFTGNVVVTPGGSVNFAPGQTGNGVYFQQCCGNSANAYYNFNGTTVGSIFSVNQGQISFYLKSRQSFAQRLASATSYRQVLDVRDANKTQLIGFYTQATSGYLMFGYTLGGAATYYIPPSGTEETVYGNGVTLKVTMSWDGSVAKLYLNDILVKQSSYTTPTPNWTAASNFDFGANEYLTNGGYNSSDDIIDEFTVTGLPSASATTGPQILLQLHSDASEVSGVTNGSIVTPAIAPPGFTGNVVVTPGGSVNFAPGQTGNGVYFLQCCGNSANAYYKFSGTTIGSIFNVNQGQISFYLKSRQSFAQRLASATSYRQVLDVRDANTTLFGFNTLATAGYLLFGYTLGGVSTYYIAPPGTEEALYGNGVTLKVTMSWDAGVAKLHLNDSLVNQSPYTAPTPSWSAASNFDLGAYEYLSYGGYNSCDDIIDELTVTGAARSQTPGMSSNLSTPRTETEASTGPVISRLQNGANESAPPVCSPEAAATLIGHFLPEGAPSASDRSGRTTSLAGTRILINGTYSPVLYASADRIDFLCPAVPPSTSLEIAVETAAGLSNLVVTRVEEASPGIFAAVVPAAGPGGTVSIRATGMNWLAKFSTVRPSARIGTQYVPIESITPDPQDSGVSTLTFKVPFDISGDSVPMVIEVVQTDGRSVTSNPAAIPVETRQRAESQVLIGQ